MLTEQWARAIEGRVVGIDLDDPKLRARMGPPLAARTSSSAPAPATRCPIADGEFEAATAMEVLEHVPDPEAVLAEMARVASRWLLVSVPREPLWRGLNLARGAYLRDLGNTPGHLNHWSKRGFASLLATPRRGRRAPLAVPWTMALLRV